MQRPRLSHPEAFAVNKTSDPKILTIQSSNIILPKKEYFYQANAMQLRTKFNASLMGNKMIAVVRQFFPLTASFVT